MEIKIPRIAIRMQTKVLPSATVHREGGWLELSDRSRYIIIAFFCAFFIVAAFLFSSPIDIAIGYRQIITAPGVLVTDYMAVANIGAALFNAGLLMFCAMILAKAGQIAMDGPVIAAIFTIGGFALFGKNIVNIWPIIMGVYLHAKFRRQKFGRFMLPALFGTALGPMVSQIAFGFGFPLIISIPLALATGLAAGFVLPPLANHFITFHQGFNLYNIGFTCGILGMAVMSLFRAFSYNVAPDTMIISSGNNQSFTILLIIYFSLMLLTGLFLSRRLISPMRQLFKQPGRLVSDFVVKNGFGPSLINMALLGLISTGYVVLAGGELNGPVIGGVMTVVGFGAFGKHVVNVLPIFGGVFLASLLKIFETQSTGAMLAVLFGTTLAPLAGSYGPLYGIAAGFIHMSIVMNVGYLHGGMNLYNNGFAGGFVAAILVPVFDVLKTRFKQEDNGEKATDKAR